MAENPEVLLSQARKKLSSATGSSWNVFANKADAAEEGANLLDEAANAFKGAGNLQRAAEIYEEASSVYENNVKDKVGASRSITEAVNLYKVIDKEKAIKAIERAIYLYKASGNFRRANGFYEQLGAIMEERGDLGKALESYLLAGQGYKVEG
jgi:tetratricopeptide (TPR) repeat protein